MCLPSIDRAVETGMALTAPDPELLGKASPPRRAVAEAGQIRLFCKAIGETNPIFLSDEAATAAGYRGQVAPPTFAFSLDLMSRDGPSGLFASLGIDISAILHGEQEFVFHDLICAGDEIVFTQRWTKFESKKDGQLLMLHSTTHATRPNGAPVVDLNGVTVVRELP
jgi:acyl dehydratase